MIATNFLDLVALTGLEIVLGIDNVIFIALLVEHVPKHSRQKLRIIGLGLALILRVILLFFASWIANLTEPYFNIFDWPASGRNILLVVGGLFLVVKSLIELKSLFSEEKVKQVRTKDKYLEIIGQIIFIDLVLSFDSIITAIGMSNNLIIIVSAIVIAMIAMIVASKPISEFIYANPSVKVIAINFILLVGIFLMVDGFEIEISKGYLYFAMFFTMVTETINIVLKGKNKNNEGNL